MAMDIIAAIIFNLELNPNFVIEFGDTWNQTTQTGVAKVFTDFSDQVPLPYTVISETGETYEYMTAVEGRTNFTGAGQLVFDIFAANRTQTRLLGFVIAGALNDIVFEWPGINNLMEFRMIRSEFVPTTDPSGPGVSIIFRRIFTFEYMYSSSLPIGSL
jgi:hypothetical protein